MIIGVPKEIKKNEYRVSLTPENVRILVGDGHQVLVEKKAGIAVAFSDKDYLRAGAQITSAMQVFDKAQMIVKVKEPQLSECSFFGAHHILLTYLHLASSKTLTKLLMKSRATCIAYETITNTKGELPLLKPMSEIAGRIATQAGACALEKHQGGKGVLLSGASGVKRAKVLVIGGGVVGRNSALVALGMGAEVVILDKIFSKSLKALQEKYSKRLVFEIASNKNIKKHIVDADLIIGAVLVAGAKAPKLITRKMLKKMQKGTVLVDVAIDQGGCFATSKPTTHKKPIYLVDGIVHYSVTNMPSAVAKTATSALTNAILPYVQRLASGAKEALLEDEHLLAGLNIYNGKVTHNIVAENLGLNYHPPITLLKP